MLFNLEIYKEYDDNDRTKTGPLIESHDAVDIQSTWLHDIIAMRDAVEIARLVTYDDYPIEIQADRIVIEGASMPHGDEGDSSYLYLWILTPATASGEIK